MDVLLIIDVQQGLFNEPRYRQEQVLANINRAAAHVRQQQGRAIYIQHDSPPVPNWNRAPGLAVAQCAATGQGREPGAQNGL